MAKTIPAKVVKVSIHNELTATHGMQPVEYQGLLFPNGNLAVLKGAKDVQVHRTHNINDEWYETLVERVEVPAEIEADLAAAIRGVEGLKQSLHGFIDSCLEPAAS